MMKMLGDGLVAQKTGRMKQQPQLTMLLLLLAMVTGKGRASQS